MASESVMSLEKSIKSVVRELETLIQMEKVCRTGRSTGDVELAIAALGKQISIKPKYEVACLQRRMEEGWDTPYCPTCGRGLMDESKDCFNYCPDCGQKIDWE